MWRPIRRRGDGGGGGAGAWTRRLGPVLMLAMAVNGAGFANDRRDDPLR
jgi:hypothetical protein